MKKLFTAIALSISLFVTAQTDSAASKKDSVKILYLAMPESIWSQFIYLIKQADEKPSVIKQYTDFLLANLKELRIPEIPKVPAKK
jgi:hypothetical protein